ncbi:MAG: hypothetical protein BJ554DRAFT_7273 [Olpidium bornovanus]|uniref:Uncharacterized protein n=1 Tax=Olpidium bornovanus TaxID=278681 RepID=A0A8H7ZWC3_9FUNG|nr:MAG: hypothetical protein BJ554DRAFT_7273 [Olpidium bornovanus]
MMKLKRVLETAKEEGRNPEDVWLERYGSSTNWEDVLAEREELDRRSGRKRRTHSNSGSAGRADRVAGGHGYSGGSNKEVAYRPSDAGGSSGGRADNYDRSLKQSKDLPQAPRACSSAAPAAASESTSPLTKDQLNKLNAKVLRARMLGSPNLAELERQFEAEKKRAEEAATAPGSSELRQGKNAPQKAKETTVVLPRVDSTGKLSSLMATKEARRAKAVGGASLLLPPPANAPFKFPADVGAATHRVPRRRRAQRTTNPATG